MVSDAVGARSEILMRNLSFKYYENFKNIASQFSSYQTRLLVLQQASRFVVEGFAVTAILVLILVSYSGESSSTPIISKIILFAIAAYKIMPAMQQANESIGRIYSSMHISENLTKQLAEFHSNKETKNTKKLEVPFKIIELRNVSYRPAPTGEFIFENINLYFEKGMKIGIIGESGSGKSTILKLIMGLAQPTSGSVYLDGNPLDTSTEAWRDRITYLPQKVSLIEGNFLDNIIFDFEAGSSQNSQILRSINLSKLDTVIAKKSDGIYANISENGANVSGGELQRIGIARAIYHNSEIIILDEMTSALDLKTEREVIKNIDEFFNEKLRIVISHRPAALDNCDVIYRVGNKTVKRLDKNELQ